MIKEEQKLVEASRKLIEIFERKIKNRIDEVWGRETPVESEGGSLMAAEETVVYDE